MRKAASSALERANISVAEFKKMIKLGAEFWNNFEGAWNAMCDDFNVPRALGEFLEHCQNCRARNPIYRLLGRFYTHWE
ncbi:MAG: hypothetical protein ACLUKN_16090 [Bacilli bacterium]